MVMWLYILIITPIVAWLVAFGYETWLAMGRAQDGDLAFGKLHTDASWEITHTLLVYAFTVFLISHAEALVVLDAVIFLPVCVFIVSLIARGCLYLYIAYSDPVRSPRIMSNLLALSYLISLGSIISGAIGVALNLRLYQFTPDTSNLAVVTFGLVLTSIFCAVPIWAAYRTTDSK